jgi:hypothetical protein
MMWHLCGSDQYSWNENQLLTYRRRTASTVRFVIDSAAAAAQTAHLAQSKQRSRRHTQN